MAAWINCNSTAKAPPEYTTHKTCLHQELWGSPPTVVSGTWALLQFLASSFSPGMDKLQFYMALNKKNIYSCSERKKKKKKKQAVSNPTDTHAWKQPALTTSVIIHLNTVQLSLCFVVFKRTVLQHIAFTVLS